MLYDVRVEVVDSTQTVAVVERTIGMRRLGPLGRSLKLEGKRWVVRGVAENVVEPASPEQWRNAAAAMIVSGPDDSLCEACSREGVLLVARIGRSGVRLKNELRRLSSWAAVGIVVLESDVRDANDIPSSAPNVLLAQYVPTAQSVVPSAWADLLACEVDQPATLAAKIADCALPSLVLKNFGGRAGLSQARAACDELQRNLAPFADVAGYLII
jgi:hypothetical protein